MSGKNSLPPFFASMIAAALSSQGQVSVVEVREGESIEDAIARIQADHRETCQDCAEAHEAEQFEAKKKQHDEDQHAARKTVQAGDTDIVGEHRAKLRAHQQAERDALDAKHKAEYEQLAKSQQHHAPRERHTGKRPEMAAPYGTGANQAGNERKPIGYMAFHVSPDGNARAIPPSFNEDQGAVQEAMNMVESHPIAQLMSGLSGTHVEVRPVFGE